MTSSSRSTEVLLAGLDGVRATGPAAWTALCPAHDDRTPSLSVRETDDRILIYCHAGCGAADVVHAVGLELGDLFPAGARTHRAVNGRRRRHRVDWRAIVIAIRHDLIVLALAGSKLSRQGLLMSDEKTALERALETVEQAVDKAGGA